MFWYSQNIKLYARGCANFCYPGMVTQPGYALTTKCCQKDNCNARCQDTDCNESNKLFNRSYFICLILCLLISIIVF